MFTKTAITLAIIVGAASGALAATKHRSIKVTTAAAAPAAPKQQRSINPSWDVYNYRGGRLGADPDPNVRSMLLHDRYRE